MSSDQCDAITQASGLIVRCLKQKWHSLPHLAEDVDMHGEKYRFTWR